MGDPNRRIALKQMAGLPLLAAAAQPGSAAALPSGSKSLVAYYSRTGNTRVLAGQIQRAKSAEIFGIETAAPYPEDYEATVKQAQRERDAGFEPKLRGGVDTIRAFEVIFLGFPIWGTTAPAAIRSFLRAHDLSGKALIPFITHGGYGIGNSLSVVQAHAPRSRVISGFSLEADQERRTLERVSKWLGVLPL